MMTPVLARNAVRQVIYVKEWNRRKRTLPAGVTPRAGAPPRRRPSSSGSASPPLTSPIVGFGREITVNRRTLLRLIGGAAVPASLGLSADDLLAAGRRLRQQTARLGALAPFDARQRETVATVAEHIIPATDTPGARAARVDEFIALLLDEWYPAEQKVEFLSGLAAFDARSMRELGRPFVTAAPAGQLGLLTALDAEARTPRAAGAAKPFFKWMKELTVSGYYSSRIGMNDERHYVIWPGRYDGCRTIGARPGGAPS